MVGLTDRLDMTLAVDWDVKPPPPKKKKKKKNDFTNTELERPVGPPL